MTNFVLLYIGGTMPEDPAQQEVMMADWGAWYGKMGEAVVDGGAPFRAAKNVTAAGVAGAAGMTPEVTGYTIISAESLDDAVAKVDGHPHIKYGGQVSVHETMEM